jgi:hypothetical protein
MYPSDFLYCLYFNGAGAAFLFLLCRCPMPGGHAVAGQSGQVGQPSIPDKETFTRERNNVWACQQTLDTGLTA